MDKDLQNIDLRSDAVHDILTRPPHSLVRYGTTVICIILLLLIALSFIFRYPDSIKGQITITTNNPPVWIVAKSSGRIKDLFVGDKKKVQQGDLIAVIDNPAITNDVRKIKTLLTEKTTITDSLILVHSDLLFGGYELGELQIVFSSFTKAYTNYKNFESLNLSKQDQSSLREQLSGRTHYADNLTKQLTLKKEELFIAQSSYERDKALYKKGVISKSDLEVSEQSFLNIQQTFRQLEGAIVSEKIETSILQSSVSKLSVEYLQDKNSKYQELNAAYRELMSEIENWEKKYLLLSPLAGNLTFNIIWSRNQFVDVGDKVFAIVPEEQNSYVGKLEMPLSGSGKVAEGQKVYVKIDGYPYLQYGVLEGYVSNVSLVSHSDLYTVEVHFSDTLISTTGVSFKFTGELKGSGEVITEDRSLASRIIAPIRYLLKNKIY